MFLHVSVILFTRRDSRSTPRGGGWGVWLGGLKAHTQGESPSPHPGGCVSQHVLRQTLPPADGFCYGQYASYWNAFLFYKRLCTRLKFRDMTQVVFNGATNLPLIVVWSYWGKLLFPFPFSLSRLTCFHWIDVVASCTKLHIAFSKSHASDLDTKQKVRCISQYEVSTVHLGPIYFITVRKHPPRQTPPGQLGRHPAEQTPAVRHHPLQRHAPGQTPLPGRQLLQRMVRILLECILVFMQALAKILSNNSPDLPL